MGRPRKNLLDKRFGKLTVIAPAEMVKRRVRWLCRCDCGKTIIVTTSLLWRGATRHCGCDRANKTHGMSNSREYMSHTDAKRRCVNPADANYARYGGRGIKFNFESFEEFYAELGPCPKGMTLDRIDNDGHYEPGNVRWATRAQQRANQSIKSWENAMIKSIKLMKAKGANRNIIVEKWLDRIDSANAGVQPKLQLLLGQMLSEYYDK